MIVVVSQFYAIDALNPIFCTKSARVCYTFSGIPLFFFMTNKRKPVIVVGFSFITATMTYNF